MKFNVNDIVKVKLKQEGYQRLADIHNSFVGRVPTWEVRDWRYYKKKADADGYTSFQLWSFMQDFGPIVALGMETPFEAEIIINE
jgi:hypothetical protein